MDLGGMMLSHGDDVNDHMTVMMDMLGLSAEELRVITVA